ncbi:MAG: hypothetical protein K6B46_03715 [Opitutales bacterium]|nr:hypothetical protein [Opitutales bacterium]
MLVKAYFAGTINRFAFPQFICSIFRANLLIPRQKNAFPQSNRLTGTGCLVCDSLSGGNDGDR